MSAAWRLCKFIFAWHPEFRNYAKSFHIKRETFSSMSWECDGETLTKNLEAGRPCPEPTCAFLEKRFRERRKRIPAGRRGGQFHVLSAKQRPPPCWSTLLQMLRCLHTKSPCGPPYPVHGREIATRRNKINVTL